MTQTLQAFVAKCSETLTLANNPAGRARVCLLLEAALRDADFIAEAFDDHTPERKLLYEDARLGFCVLAHNYLRAKQSAPHDHGPSWAIYGQASGETAMSDWALVEPATPTTAGKVRKVREYRLVPGAAHVYNEGDLHSPSRTGPTRLIRIEGTNMEKVRRLRYEPVA
ncbi:MAG TPA: hypothetical protein VHP37_32325 [Burkholderiales bacterium]|nr:hypothetical protein [Burkholderiales bacterium]